MPSILTTQYSQPQLTTHNPQPTTHNSKPHNSKPMTPPKFKSIPELYEFLPDNERLILDILRGIILDLLPSYCSEKISYNVPYYYGNRGICILWPSSVPRGGIKEGVLFGLWQGNRLGDFDGYLTRGTNKKIFYKIFTNTEEIEIKRLSEILKHAILFDKSY